MVSVNAKRECNSLSDFTSAGNPWMCLFLFESYIIVARVLALLVCCQKFLMRVMLFASFVVRGKSACFAGVLAKNCLTEKL